MVLKISILFWEKGREKMFVMHTQNIRVEIIVNHKIEWSRNQVLCSPNRITKYA